MTKLKILQQNVGCHWFSPYDPPNCIHRLETIAYHSLLEKIDIFNLQELYTLGMGIIKRNKELSVLTEILKENDIIYSAPCSEKTCRIFGMDLGLRIFSKYPITQYTLWAFQLQDSYNIITPNKGVLDVEILVDGKKIGILNIHLSSKNNETRTNQLLELQQYIEKNIDIFNQHQFTFIMGDFNMPLNEFIGLKNILPEGVSTHNSNRQIDNVFLKTDNDIQLNNVEIVNWKNARGDIVSDHRGVIIDLTF
jgi:endonuclease/exonuclease/phosphatase family metal-dependent hydrolase